jgi:hypothetical protein
MFSTITSIVKDDDFPIYRGGVGAKFSLFISDARLEEVGSTNEATSEDTKLRELKEALRATAVEQGVTFDPDVPVEYGYMPTRSGFWFRNSPNGQLLTLPLNTNRDSSDGSPNHTHSWWQIWKR